MPAAPRHSSDAWRGGPDIARLSMRQAEWSGTIETNPMPAIQTTTIEQHLGDKAEYLLGFDRPKILKDRLHLPGPDSMDRSFTASDRNNRVLVNLQRIVTHGR